MNKQKLIKALPAALFYVGLAGVFISEVLTVRDTIKASKILRDNPVEITGDEESETHYYADNTVTATLCSDKLTYAKVVVRETWKCFIPSFVSTTLTIGTLVASRRLTVREIAALSSAVASTAGLVTKYRKAILDRTDETVLSEIDAEVAQAQMKDTKPVYMNTGHLTTSEYFSPNEDGEFIFFDPLTKCKFKSTKLIMNSARYYLNRNFALGCAVPLEMFYNFCGVELPEEYRFMEWDADKMSDDGYCWIDIDFTRSKEVDPETGEYYYIIEYNFDPGELEDGPFEYPFGNPMLTEGSYVV